MKLSVSVSVRLSLCLLLKLWTPQKGSGDVRQLFFFLLAQRWYSLYSCLLWVMTSPTSSSLRKQTDSKPCRIIIILQRWLSTYCCHREQTELYCQEQTLCGHEALDRKVYHSVVKYLEKYSSECFPPWWNRISTKNQVLVFCGCRD